jgi:transcriptional regulator with XRE-family HTH domain
MSAASTGVDNTDGLWLSHGMYLRKEFGARLKQRREALKLTQEAVADTAGVSRTSYLGYEAGTHFPKDHALARIAEVLDTSVDWLMRGPAAKAETLADGGESAEPERTARLRGLDADVLVGVVVAVEEYLEREGIRLKPEKKAELVVLLYQDMVEKEEGEQLDQARLTRMIKLAI